MSAKIQIHPSAADEASSEAQPANDRVDAALSCIRQVLSDAQQICSDVTDVEDARDIAENIVATCRRALAGRRSSPGDPRASRPPQHRAGLAVAPVRPVRPDKSTKAAARTRLDSLSARELEIFTHLAEGRTAAEIAIVLSRSSKTINNHRTRILQKLGLKNATELVRLAVHSGLVSV